MHFTNVLVGVGEGVAFKSEEDLADSVVDLFLAMVLMVHLVIVSVNVRI